MSDGKKTLLVLGGTGSVGSRVCRRALLEGWKVCSLTRRGAPADTGEAFGGVEWRACDATNARALLTVIREVKPDAIVHCIGALFDCNSWLYSLNRSMSGCGSVPDKKKGTYENIIKQTAMNALHAIAFVNRDRLPFIFLSACEVGWKTGDNGCLGTVAGYLAPPFLQEYLRNKAAVEAAMLRGVGVPDICKRRAGAARPVVFRPSLVVSDDNARHALSLLMSFNPVSDPPVHVDHLAAAIVLAASDPSVRGVYRRRDIE
eukprot:gene9156-14199_t